jgi:hypothetical protein
MYMGCSAKVHAAKAIISVLFMYQLFLFLLANIVHLNERAKNYCAKMNFFLC